MSEDSRGRPSRNLNALRAPITAAFDCPYLPGRQSRSEVYLATGIDGQTYEALMPHDFRRSGRMIYRPVCPNCRECKQLRVITAEFKTTRSMRRVWNRNEDVNVSIHPPKPDTRKYDLFRRYLDSQHDETMTRSYEAFCDFLYTSPLQSYEIRYELGRRLMAVSIADVCPTGLSSVYVFFDPEFRSRSPGTYSVLWEIEFCRNNGLPHYYLGFYVAGSKTMNYKARFRPCETADPDGNWRPLED